MATPAGYRYRGSHRGIIRFAGRTIGEGRGTFIGHNANAKTVRLQSIMLATRRNTTTVRSREPPTGGSAAQCGTTGGSLPGSPPQRAPAGLTYRAHHRSAHPQRAPAARTYHRRRCQPRLGRLTPVEFETIMNKNLALTA
ncbi:hypothetical protein GCM10010407_14250 [Rarobacter incanus]